MVFLYNKCMNNNMYYQQNTYDVTSQDSQKKPTGGGYWLKKIAFGIFYFLFSCGLFGGICFIIAFWGYAMLLAHSTQNILVIIGFYVGTVVLITTFVGLLIYEVHRNAKLNRNAQRNSRNSRPSQPSRRPNPTGMQTPSYPYQGRGSYYDAVSKGQPYRKRWT